MGHLEAAPARNPVLGVQQQFAVTVLQHVLAQVPWVLECQVPHVVDKQSGPSGVELADQASRRVSSYVAGLAGQRDVYGATANVCRPTHQFS